MIGSALTPILAHAGHRVIKLTRAAAAAPDARAFWNPATGMIDLTRADSLEAVVHLAGESIAQRWTPAAQARIRDSRIRGTKLLCEALTRLPRPPRVLLSASATGYYGHRGDEMLDESSAPGTGFLAEVTREWETATQSAMDAGIRVVHLRLGIVLASEGGALAKMLPAFRLGLGGRLGDGKHYWSWIALADALRVITHALASETLVGPFNVVAPNPVTNREFTEALGAVLRRPTIFTVPALAVKLLFGEMGREALLGSARVRPVKLAQSGFNFQFPELAPALQHLLATQLA